MMNRVVLVGRLTKDPELRYTQNGIAVASFILAVNRTFTNAQGEREADFINCIIWRKPAENVANFLKKGSLAGVDGRIQTRSYEGQDGKRVYVTEVLAESVQFLEPKNSTPKADNFNYGAAPQEQNYGYSNPSQNQPSYNRPKNDYQRNDNNPFASDSGPIDISDDDLPF